MLSASASAQVPPHAYHDNNSRYDKYSRISVLSTQSFHTLFILGSPHTLFRRLSDTVQHSTDDISAYSLTRYHFRSNVCPISYRVTRAPLRHQPLSPRHLISPNTTQRHCNGRHAFPNSSSTPLDIHLLPAIRSPAIAIGIVSLLDREDQPVLICLIPAHTPFSTILTL